MLLDMNNLRLPATFAAGQTLPQFIESTHAAGHLAGYTLSAKSQMYRGIVLSGVNEERTERAVARTGNRLVKMYNVFNPYYGIEDALHRITLHFVASAYGAESSRQVLGLFGPPGSAKSAISDDLKGILVGLEQMACLSGSPMRDNPLNAFFLIRGQARRWVQSRGISFEDALAEVIDSLRVLPLLDWENRDLVQHLSRNGAAGKSGMDALLAMQNPTALARAIVFGLGLSKTTVANIGYPDSLVEARVLGLRASGSDESGNEFMLDGDEIDLANYLIGGFKYEMDVEGSVGIATLTEVDEKFFSNTKMYGSLNMRALLEHDSTSPYAAFYNGVFNVGSRGYTEFAEGVKNGVQGIRAWLEVTQRHVIPSPGSIVRNTFVDTICAVTSNMAEWMEKIVQNPAMAPYLSRIDPIIVGYPRDHTAIVQVIGKLDDMSDFPGDPDEGGCHEQPGVRRYLSMYAAATRIKPRDGKALIDLVRIYGGEVDRLPFSQQAINVADFLADAPLDEGLDGDDDRALNKRFLGIEQAEQVQHWLHLQQTKPDAEPAEATPCVTTAAVKRRLKAHIKTNVLDKDRQKLLLEFVDGDLEKERLRMAADPFFAAADLTFDSQCQVVFVNYMEEIDDKRKAERNKDLPMGQIKSLEEQARELESDPVLGVTEGGKKDFRSFLVRSVSDWTLKKGNEGREVSYKDFPLLAEAIRKLVAKRNKDAIAVCIRKDNSVRREEDRRRAETIQENLIAAGHCRKCAFAVEFDARTSGLFAEVR